jgi:hypothetical protein
MTNIQINDVVHATFYNEVTRSSAAQGFKVTNINGTSYEGGALPCDTAAGWTLEIVKKDFANLNLPTVISEITVTDRSNNEHKLVGKNDLWRDMNGKFFAVDLIIEWRDGHKSIPPFETPTSE